MPETKRQVNLKCYLGNPLEPLGAAASPRQPSPPCDSLARVRDFAGVSGTISFDGAGNNRAEVALAPLK
jgi:hypothetical protein